MDNLSILYEKVPYLDIVGSPTIILRYMEEARAAGRRTQGVHLGIGCYPNVVRDDQLGDGYEPTWYRWADSDDVDHAMEMADDLGYRFNLCVGHLGGSVKRDIYDPKFYRSCLRYLAGWHAYGKTLSGYQNSQLYFDPELYGTSREDGGGNFPYPLGLEEETLFLDAFATFAKGVRDMGIFRTVSLQGSTRHPSSDALARHTQHDLVYVYRDDEILEAWPSREFRIGCNYGAVTNDLMEKALDTETPIKKLLLCPGYRPSDYKKDGYEYWRFPRNTYGITPAEERKKYRD